LFITLGIFVANCINFGTEANVNTSSWRIPMGITYLWALILGLGMAFFPESPRYDYRHGKVEKSIDTLAKIYGVPRNHRALHIEFDEIREKYEDEKRHGHASWIQLFRAPTMSYRVAVGVALQALQQLTGANYFFYYVSRIHSFHWKTEANTISGNNHLPRRRYQKQLRDSDDPGWRKLWNDFPWSLPD
jgi:SP family sugar:H+ symporter-like MFS transporter